MTCILKIVIIIYIQFGGTNTNYTTLARCGGFTFNLYLSDVYSNVDTSQVVGGGTITYQQLDINGVDQGTIATYETTAGNTANFTNATIPTGWNTNSTTYYGTDPLLRWTAGDATAN